ncbi:hypothetical protein OS175_03720 [Marinicella sp. S1101]|uniref:hypothetical protein n=1 Tax=Marinicella marina TaxID=2996016 RepID=UPI00226095E6|nr:hypothetical protein [Marinicella marina]MCX7552976.1 hypothetical protein [Marinicella marina]MDJ1139714.1 hypothetical protein [Marinicella marina]
MKKNNPFIAAVFLTLVLFLAACGSRVPRSELQDLRPLVEIVAFDISLQNLKLRISHRNKTTRENNQLNCQLAIKDLSAIQFEQVALPDLTNYAKETIDINWEKPANFALSNQPSELPYVLDCYLYAENFRDERVIKKGSLYKVPGTSGEYR